MKFLIHDCPSPLHPDPRYLQRRRQISYPVIFHPDPRMPEPYIFLGHEIPLVSENLGKSWHFQKKGPSEKKVPKVVLEPKNRPPGKKIVQEPKFRPGAEKWHFSGNFELRHDFSPEGQIFAPGPDFWHFFTFFHFFRFFHPEGWKKSFFSLRKWKKWHFARGARKVEKSRKKVKKVPKTALFGTFSVGPFLKSLTT